MLIRPRHLAILLALLSLFVPLAHAQSEKAPENVDRLSSVANLDAAQISKINTYGDYQQGHEDPDFYVHVAEKEYRFDTDMTEI